MSLFFNNLLRAAISHYQATGWGGSVVVHLLGVWVASTTFVTFAPPEQPELIGQKTAADIELLATWSQPQRPEPIVEIITDDPQVVVMPRRATIAEQTFLPADTDVAQPTPYEVAMADHLLALPPAVRPRRSDAAATENQPPPQRHTLRQKTLPAHSESRPVSVGTSDRTPPQLLDNRPPTYPERALIDRLEGTVVLRLRITSEGRVEWLKVFSSSGHAILDAAAAQAVRSWRFAPASSAGRPTAATVRLPVRFSLDTQ